MFHHHFAGFRFDDRIGRRGDDDGTGIFLAPELHGQRRCLATQREYSRAHAIPGTTFGIAQRRNINVDTALLPVLAGNLGILRAGESTELHGVTRLGLARRTSRLKRSLGWNFFSRRRNQARLRLRRFRRLGQDTAVATRLDRQHIADINLGRLPAGIKYGRHQHGRRFVLAANLLGGIRRITPLRIYTGSDGIPEAAIGTTRFRDIDFIAAELPDGAGDRGIFKIGESGQLNRVGNPLLALDSLLGSAFRRRHERLDRTSLDDHRLSRLRLNCHRLGRRHIRGQFADRHLFAPGIDDAATLLVGEQLAAKFLCFGRRRKTGDIQPIPGFLAFNAVVDPAIQARAHHPAIHLLRITTAQIAPGRTHGIAVIQAGHLDLPEGLGIDPAERVQLAHGRIDTGHRESLGAWRRRRFCRFETTGQFTGRALALARGRRRNADTATERQEQGSIAAVMLHLRTLELIEITMVSPLGFEQRQMVGPAHGVNLGIDFPRATRRIGCLALCIEPLAGQADGGQCAFDLAHCLVNCPGVVLDHFLVHGLAVFLLAFALATVENARRDAGHRTPEEELGQEELRQHVAAVTALRRQIDRRQDPGPRHVDIGIRREQPGFGHADIWSAQQQRRWQTGHDRRHAQRVEPQVGQRNRPGHRANQESQRVERIFALLLDGRDCCTQTENQRLLLLEVAYRRIAQLKPALHGAQRGTQDFFGFPRNAQAVVQRSIFDITGDDVGRDIALDVIALVGSTPQLQIGRLDQ